jgi:hypothetical protein
MQAKIENRRRAAIAVTGGTLAAVAVMSVLWMRDGGGGGPEAVPAPSTTSAELPEAPTATAVPAPPAPPATRAAPAAAPAPAPTPAPVLEDGRHPVFLTDIDLATSTLEFDLLQYPTGDEAHRYAEAHEDEYGEAHYEHEYIVNESTRLRRLPVMSSVDISVQDNTEGGLGRQRISFDALPAHVGPRGGGEPGAIRLGFSMYWLTVQDETVVAMEEEYVQ